MSKKLFVLLLVVLALPLFADEPVKVDEQVFTGLAAREIGPAATGGRVAAVAAVKDKGRTLVYVGAAGGGLWKSPNGGTTFKPVFDKYNQSIGAIAIDPKNHDTVWVGTGESWMRNSVSVGDGVYKTTDGGDNWQKLGLEKTEHIAALVLDPEKSDTAFVCATGHLWDSNPERGVFKTTDGGKTWNKVLFVNDDTGCSSISMDPQDSHILYAGMWQFRRTPWSFSSGGPGSGLFKSTDGGATWRKVSKGLPAGDLGRIAVAVAPSRTSVVYAVVEARHSALFRSDDLGESWTQVNDSFNVIGRPFYFALLTVDPKDYNRVYKPGFGLTVSDDGGKTFTGIGNSAHGDFHALWVDPDNTEHLLTASDGGFYSSVDRGNTWTFHGNLPIAQFYHVAYDMERPYNVYGGLQDHATWYGPSTAPGGIYNRHWKSANPGDGFWAWPDANDPDYMYSETQGGKIQRQNMKTGEARDIMPSPGPGEPKYRFNWNTPVYLSPTQKGTVYIGSQFLFRSRDRGDSWEKISPDLTTNDPEKQKQEQSGGLTVDNSDAETHTTIFAIAESPKNPNLIWVGTDDGNLQITRDGGKNWANVVTNIAGLPRNTWVSSVEPSHYDEGTAFATFDGHSTGDMKTYIFKTTDYGKSWKALATSDVTGYAHIIRQDTVNPDLLFAGTEFGLFLSVDGGTNWARFKGGNFPPVAVRDIKIHQRDRDLILATHGRGVWILDDLTPLRALTSKVLDSEVAFLPTRDSVQTIPSFDFGFPGDAEFVGQPAADDAVIAYYLKKRHMFGDLKLEIYDPEGKLISTVDGGKRKGLNRVTWSMRMKPPKVPPAAGSLVPNLFSLMGPRVLDGTYTVKMIKGKETYNSELKLMPDPRSTHTRAEREAQFKTAMQAYNLLSRLTYVVDSVVDSRNQARDRVLKLVSTDPLRKRVQNVADTLDAMRGKLIAVNEAGGITGEMRIREYMVDLYGSINGYEGAPTKSQLDRLDALTRELDGVANDYAALNKQVENINAELQKKKIEPMRALTREEWDKKQTAGN
ncbi:MAG TPA: glycosyl hydrolase [Terriglobales bacterium]|nr:glycosyl hydrolase [Terriglobales bacterium]